MNFAQSNDPTLISLYTKMKNIVGDPIYENESSIHVLKSVCAQSKSECYKAKIALQNQDQPVGVRIERAINILDNAIRPSHQDRPDGFLTVRTILISYYRFSI